MSIVLKLAKVTGVFMAGLVAGILCCQGFHWLIENLRPLNPPSPSYAKALLNDCDGFNVMGLDFRRTVSIKSISHPSSGNNVGVEFEWRWVSGEKAKDATTYRSSASFLYSDEKKEWTAVSVITPSIAGASGMTRLDTHCR